MNTVQGEFFRLSQPVRSAVFFEAGTVCAFTVRPAFRFGNLARLELVIHFGQFELNPSFLK